MSLPERLHRILVTLREAFGSNLPDPAELTHSGELTIRGEEYVTRSSVPIDDIAQQEKFTVYLHCTGDHERVHYFHFEGRKELSSVYVRLDMAEGGLRQSVTLSSLPREIFVQRVEKSLGRGPPREKRMRRDFPPRREARPPPPPPMLEENSDEE